MARGTCWELSICSDFDSLELDGICHLSFGLKRIRLRRVIWSNESFVNAGFGREICVVLLSLWGTVGKPYS